MIQINLLPIKQIRLRLRRRREVFILIGSLLAVIGLLAAGTLLLGVKINGLKAEIVELDKKKTSLQAIQRQITALEKEKELLQTKINTVKGLLANSKLPVRVLDEISNRTPSQRLWINSLRLTGNSLTIAGVGLDNPTIAQYMQTLERSLYFGGVDLASTTQTDMGGQKLKTFSLTMMVTAPPEPEEESGEEGKPESQPQTAK